MPLDAVILCERESHLRRAQAEAPEAAVIALTPESVWACQDQGVRYLRLDDFYSGADLNAFAETLLKRQYAWAQWVDARLAESIPEFGAARFAPARAQLWYLKQMLDMFLRAAKVLQGFFANAQPQRVIVFERPPLLPSALMSVFQFGPIDSPDRPFFAWLAPTVIGGLACVEVWPDEHASPGGMTSAATGRLGRLVQLAREYRASIVRDLIQQGGRNLFSRRARVAWIGSRGYDLQFAIPHLRRRRIALVRPSPFSDSGRPHRAEAMRLRTRLAERWDAIAQPEFWRPVDMVTPTLRPHVEPFLKRWLLQDVPAIWAQYLGMRAWLRKGRFDAVIGVEVSLPAASAAFLAAEGLGIPRIMAIHNGGFTMDIPAQDCLGPIQSDLYLVSCEEERRYYERMDERLGIFPRARCVSVGSARLERLRTMGTSRRVKALRAHLTRGAPGPLLLYIPTLLQSYARHFTDGNMSDVAYVELQQRILRCIAEFPRVRLLYKPFPGEAAINPLPQLIARAVRNGSVVSMPLTQLVWAVDAIIIDFPSTALAEAAVTDKPLLVYAGRDWARLLPQANAALKKRAWVSETPEEFEAQVRQFLSAGNFAPVVNPDQEFLHFVGVEASEKRAAERATDAIEEIVCARTSGRGSGNCLPSWRHRH